jgi:hypothetical protein
VSFKVGDFVEHYRMPLIWRIEAINKAFESAYEVDSAALLALYWSPDWWPNKEVYQNPNCRLATAIQAGKEVHLYDLHPVNAMLVLALAANR